ncbi:MAG TPA: Hpt domain-containing protein [Stellaceae bacterium]|jgi:HPt (histidine-containing phosphotransfer) domain-containing protein|nr:Hpt domain-containing protein [Stellaceae bacterium]
MGAEDNGGLIDIAALDMLEDRLGREAVLRVVQAQLKFGAQVADKLEALVHAPDAKAVRAIAHQMAGSSASVGLTRLGEVAMALEIILIEDEAYPGLVADVASLRDLARASLAELARAFPDA